MQDLYIVLGKLAMSSLRAGFRSGRAPLAWPALGMTHCRICRPRGLWGFLRGSVTTCCFACPNESTPATHAVFLLSLFFLFALEEGVGSLICERKTRGPSGPLDKAQVADDRPPASALREHTPAVPAPPSSPSKRCPWLLSFVFLSCW